MNKALPKAQYHGILRLPPIALQCCVLDTRDRVITRVGFSSLLLLRPPRVDKLQRALKYLSTFNRDLKVDPIRYLVNAEIVYGHEARAVTDILWAFCNAAESRGGLVTNQITARARSLLKAFCKSAGLIALIDEATEYQRVRPHNELGTILQREWYSASGD